MKSPSRSEEHTSELQSQSNLVCRLLLEKKNKNQSHLRPPLHDARRFDRASRQRERCAFFLNETATTDIYTLSLHDALPISVLPPLIRQGSCAGGRHREGRGLASGKDRKSTRLNSSHSQISYAVFCLKK